MVLLEVPGARDWYTVRNASNLELTEYYPVIAPEGAGNLGALLDDEDYWRQQAARAAPLADKYFADFRGNSAERAAGILSNIDALLAQGEGQA